MTHSLPGDLLGVAPRGVCAAPFPLPLPLPPDGPLPPALVDDEAVVRADLFADVPPDVPEADAPCDVESDGGVTARAEDAACWSDSGRI